MPGKRKTLAASSLSIYLHNNLMPKFNRLAVLLIALGIFFSLRPGAMSAWTQNPAADLISDYGAFQSDTEWVGPLNLSRSGATTNPHILIDSSGRYHVLWEDEIEGFVYVTSGSGGWSDPIAVETPFSTRRAFPELQPQSETPRFVPHLVADLDGNIHAFWVDDVSDPAGILMHSSVPGNAFTQFDAWSAPESIETGAVGPAGIANGNGLHIAYVRRVDSPDRPAGIYYRRLASGGGSWSDQRLIYASRYLRALTGETANVSIAAATSGRVYLAWDDPAREQVFASRSADGGASWEAPFEIDRRSAGDAPGSVGPGGVAVGVGATGAVITWRAGHQASRSCTPYYRSLPETGTAWSLPQIIPGLDDCLDTTQFLAGGGVLYLLGSVAPAATAATVVSPQTYLLAWDGSRWSEPQPQTALGAFTNPETNQPINLHCVNGATVADQLSVVGCDQGVGGDIWWTSRSLGDTAAWFPPPAVWEGPVAVAAAAAPVAGMGMVADATGRSHVLWFEAAGRQIFHASRDETGWSGVRQVLTSDSGALETIAVGGNGSRLLLVFRDTGGLHFAQADAQQPTQWTTPTALVEGQGDIGEATLFVSGSGEFIVAYPIGLNEPRGIYLVRSADRGASWSEPAQIFSGAAAGWPAVGPAYLAETAGGRLHAIVSERALPPDNAIIGLDYSRSDDGGATWSAAVPVVETPTRWAAIFGDGERVVHLLWAEPANDRLLLWHALSTDNGDTWGEGSQVGSVDGSDLPVATIDPTGQLHILGMDGGRLLSWTFNGAEWSAGEALTVNLADGGLLDAAVDSTGYLIGAYAVAIPGSSDGEATGGLFAVERPLDLPAAALPTPPPPPATATPAPTIAPTAAPQPTPTIMVPTAPDAGLLSGVPGAGSRTGQLAIAVIPAALVVLIAVIVGLRALRKGGG